MTDDAWFTRGRVLQFPGSSINPGCPLPSQLSLFRADVSRAYVSNRHELSVSTACASWGKVTVILPCAVCAWGSPAPVCLSLMTGRCWCYGAQTQGLMCYFPSQNNLRRVCGCMVVCVKREWSQYWWLWFLGVCPSPQRSLQQSDFCLMPVLMTTAGHNIEYTRKLETVDI